MNKEEKKAIEELKEEINKPLEVPEDIFDTFILYNIENAKILLKLVEKQQEEIEELKENQIWDEAPIEGPKPDVIHKDKIREKIKEIDKYLEQNRKALNNAIGSLNLKKIDMIVDRISINLAIRDILNELLEEK